MNVPAPGRRKRRRPDSYSTPDTTQQLFERHSSRPSTEGLSSFTQNQLRKSPEVQQTIYGILSSKTDAATLPQNTFGSEIATSWENQEFCHSCGDGGDLICCDFCVSSYHGVCLDLAIDQSSDPWACPQCSSAQQRVYAALSERAHLPRDDDILASWAEAAHQSGSREETSTPLIT